MLGAPARTSSSSPRLPSSCTHRCLRAQPRPHSNSGKDIFWLNSKSFIAAHVWSRVVKSNLCRQMSASALLSWGTRAQAVEPQTTPWRLSNKLSSRCSSLNGDILFQQIHTPLVPATTLGMAHAPFTGLTLMLPSTATTLLQTPPGSLRFPHLSTSPP